MNDLHEFVCDLARRAGEIQLSRVDEPGEVHEKAPKDIVTEVDLFLERMMVSRIEERYPDDAILGEESGGEVSPTGRTWLLDPVDGTANFSRANPLYCACVSVVEGGEVTHAAVAVPRLGDIYHAQRGAGAFVIRDEDGSRKPLRVSETRQLEYAFVGADLSFATAGGDPPESGPGRVFAAAWQLRALGSAGVRGAWTAAGYIDVSVGTRPTVWDYAPTALLVAEAGGRSTDLSGNPWRLDSDGLIATNGHLHDEVISTLNG